MPRCRIGSSKELRLRKISDPDAANRFLKEEFIPWFNATYGVEPSGETNLHRALTRPERERLPAVLSRQHERTVQNDFTVRFSNRWHQITQEQAVTIRPQEKVVLEERLDGSLHIRFRGKYLNYRILSLKPPQTEGCTCVGYSCFTKIREKALQTASRPSLEKRIHFSKA